MCDYAELVKLLRECGSRRDCLDCPYDNDASYCIEPRITEAADAIEELLARVDHLKNCVYEALDALDRGNDNDWARKALENAEPPKGVE